MTILSLAKKTAYNKAIEQYSMGEDDDECDDTIVCRCFKILLDDGVFVPDVALKVQTLWLRFCRLFTSKQL